ncbi:protein FAR1-RELATED SEQUENCE 5-like [Camellia sinensis]|uniref:protein FAR1-RELATED SEQUENCE 5-like n=1 Tax=Camellia sinensis TaxID=4442 RepID=UPI001036A523|nr:protein FAR1-RELATED SEQUENCE 5-like [Camellia sinensis]
MNAFFDGYVNPKTTLKQFVEQYDNALRNKVEKEKKADFKSRHKLFDCLTIYGFEWVLDVNSFLQKNVKFPPPPPYQITSSHLSSEFFTQRGEMEVDSNVEGENPLINEGKHVEEPKKGMCFSSREEVYTFYGKYAKHVGFAIAHRAQHFGDDGQLLNFAIECSRAGQRRKTSELNPLKPCLSTKIGCTARRRLEINDEAGIGVSKNFHSMVVEAGGYESLTFDERDARNYIERARRNLFWADARSRATYEAFGDVVSFDTTYLTNKYDMPFAPFVGVNHRGQSILLGCGLLSSEDTNTFVWLFKSWLSCMSNHPPKAIITDQCRAMQNAIKIVFPQTRHRWCLWHIMKKIPEKLKGYAQYEAIKLAMQNAVYDCLTRAEFESKWEEMLATFNLYDNEWLGVLYDERNRWVPVYVKDIFWAGM